MSPFSSEIFSVRKTNAPKTADNCSLYSSLNILNLSANTFTTTINRLIAAEWRRVLCSLVYENRFYSYRQLNGVLCFQITLPEYDIIDIVIDIRITIAMTTMISMRYKYNYK